MPHLQALDKEVMHPEITEGDMFMAKEHEQVPRGEGFLTLKQFLSEQAIDRCCYEAANPSYTRTCSTN